MKNKFYSSNLSNYHLCDENELNLYDIWLILKKRKKLIGLFTLIFTTIGLIYILLTPPVYKTETSIFPLVDSKLNNKITVIASSLIGFSVYQPSLTIEAILKSKTLKARIIQKLNLMPLLFEEKWDKKNKNWKTKKTPSILEGIEKLDKLMVISIDKKQEL